MKRWSVTARAFDRNTGLGVSAPRTEIVNSKNILFQHCKDPVDVKTAYERFWNDLNPESTDIVFVSEVLPLGGK